MDNERDNEKNSDDKRSRSASRNPNILIPLLLLAALMFMILYSWNDGTSSISYSYFQNLLDGRDADGEILTDDDDEPYGCMIEYMKFTPGGATGIFKMLPDAEGVYNAEGIRTKPKADAKLKKRFSVESSTKSVKPASMLSLMKTTPTFSLGTTAR